MTPTPSEPIMTKHTDEELIAIAKAATPGPYQKTARALCASNGQLAVYARPIDDDSDIDPLAIAPAYLDFLHALNPAFVLSLIERARAAESSRDEAIKAKSETVENYEHLLREFALTRAAKKAAEARARTAEEALKGAAPYALGTLDSIIHHSGDPAEVAEAHRVETLVRALSDNAKKGSDK